MRAPPFGCRQPRSDAGGRSRVVQTSGQLRSGLAFVVLKINTTQQTLLGEQLFDTPQPRPRPLRRAGGEQKTPGTEREGTQDPRRHGHTLAHPRGPLTTIVLCVVSKINTTDSIRAGAYLSNRVARCMAAVQGGGVHRGDSGPFGPGVCSIPDMNVAEHLFHDVGE